MVPQDYATVKGVESIIMTSVQLPIRRLSPQQQAYALRMPRWATVKRMASYNDLSGLVDQINGSERLRFGRK
uniref:Uncharacterized protein n=1 Tax=Ditylenchus dipsaci TaxID=166011 RepID=A0A915EIZ1_9BILA